MCSRLLVDRFNKVSMHNEVFEFPGLRSLKLALLMDLLTGHILIPDFLETPA